MVQYRLAMFIRRIWRVVAQVFLMALGGLEFVLAVWQLPNVINQTHFFDIRSMIALLIFLLAAGLLPVGITKTLMQRPTGWIFLIASQIFWFSWVGLEIDILQEILQAIL